MAGENEINVDVTTSYDGSGVEEARADMDELRSESADVRIGGDSTPLTEAVADAEAKLAELKEYAATRVEIGASTDELDAKVAQAEEAIAQAKEFAEAPAEINFDVGEAEAKLAALNARIDELLAKEQALREFNPSINTSQFQTQIASLSAAAKSLDEALIQTRTATQEADAGFEEVEAGAARAATGIGAMAGIGRATASDIEELGKNSENAAGSIDSLGSSAGRSIGRFAAFNPIITTILATLPAAAAAFLGLGAAMEASALGAIAVIGGWSGIKAAWEQAAAALEPLKEALSQTFQQNLTGPFLALANVLNQAEPEFRDLASAISDVVSALLPGASAAQAFAGAVEDAANFFQRGVAGAHALGDAISTMTAAASPELGKIADAISNIYEAWDKAVQKLSQTGDLQSAFAAGAQAIHAFGDALAAIGTVLTQIAAKAGPAMADALEHLASALEKNGPAIAAFANGFASVMNVFAEVADAIGTVVQALGPFGTVLFTVVGALVGVGAGLRILASVAGAVAGVFSPLVNIVRGLGAAAETAGSEAAASAGGWSSIAGTIGTVGAAALRTVPQVAAIGVAFVAAESVVKSVASNFGDFTQDIQMNVDGLVKEVSSAFQGDWKGAWEGMVQAAKGAANVVIDVINTIIQAIMNFQQAVASFFQAVTGVNQVQVNIPQIPRFATGGIFGDGGMALVGENGPELINLPGGSQISPSSYLPDSMTGGNGNMQLQLQVVGGSDSMLAALIANMARTGRLKISARAITPN